MSEELNPIATVDDDGTIKLDFRKDAIQEQSTDEIPVRDESETSGGVLEEDNGAADEPIAREEDSVQDVQVAQEVEESALQEITDEEVEEVTDELQEEVAEAIAESAVTGIELPENIQ
jgi:hypothetical protein